jgi:hypothetical protein
MTSSTVKGYQRLLVVTPPDIISQFKLFGALKMVMGQKIPRKMKGTPAYAFAIKSCSITLGCAVALGLVYS